MTKWKYVPQYGPLRKIDGLEVGIEDRINAIDPNAKSEHDLIMANQAHQYHFDRKAVEQAQSYTDLVQKQA